MKKIWLFLFMLLFMPLSGGRLSDPIGRYQKYQGYLNQLDLEADAAKDKKRLIDVQRQINNVFRDFAADFCYLESYINDSDLKKMENDFSACMRKCEKRINAWIYNRLYYSRRYDNVLDELISTQIRIPIPPAPSLFDESSEEELEVPVPIRIANIDHWLDEGDEGFLDYTNYNSNYNSLEEID